METLPLCFRKRPVERFITQEGYTYIVLGFILSCLALKVFGLQAALPFFLLTFYMVAFFRNPKRPIPKDDHCIVAPADGKILEVVECEEKKYLQSRAKKISIFMSPFNCHMNRSPVAGEVMACFYKKGSFKAAFGPKAIENNEHHAFLLKDKKGYQWLVIQIAGFLARRIVSYVQRGDLLEAGERFGLIQFGSRTDLYCPLQSEIFVKAGDKVFGGKTILGRIL